MNENLRNQAREKNVLFKYDCEIQERFLRASDDRTNEVRKDSVEVRKREKDAILV